MKTPQILPQKQPDGTSTTTEALEAYDLGGVDCALCGNSGTIIRKDEDGVLYSRECDCMPKRRWLRRVRRSGMEDLLARCRFETYEESGEEQKHVLEAATQYAAADRPRCTGSRPGRWSIWPSWPTRPWARHEKRDRPAGGCRGVQGSPRSWEWRFPFRRQNSCP